MDECFDRAELIAFVRSCARDDGGFAGSPERSSQLLYTLSALQVLAIVDALDEACDPESGFLDRARTAAFVASLQQADGSFCGDAAGEVDTRFSYCALSACALVGRLDAVDVSAACDFVLSCRNFDGSFGAVPGGESHGGQVFCCLGALSIGGRLGDVDADLLGWWLSERQCDSGGLNGRPEKQADVCYSWWDLSGMLMLGREAWISRHALTGFILRCQDADAGGISDRPDDQADIYHTFFGIAGLAMLGHLPAIGERCNGISPVYALPQRVVDRLGLPSQLLPPIDAEGAVAPGGMLRGRDMEALARDGRRDVEMAEGE